MPFFDRKIVSSIWVLTTFPFYNIIIITNCVYRSIMKKSFFRILVTLFAAAVLGTALFACSEPEDSVKYTGLNVTRNGTVVTEISFTEGGRIDYSLYQLLVSLSDDTSFSVPLSEGAFEVSALSELYALSGGITKNMTIHYQNEGKSVRGMINVNVLKPQTEVKTYTLNYQMEKDYASIRFNPLLEVTRITSLPQTHPDLPIYNRIEWYRDLSNPTTKIELPYELNSDLTVYGKVIDTRRYTVRFWKDKDGDNYQNQIGGDVSAKEYPDTVNVPTENIDKVGFDFVEWQIDGVPLNLYGEIGNKYFYLREVAGEYNSYPDVQIINVCAVYSVKNYKVRFGYVDEQGDTQSFDAPSYYASVYNVKHGSVLKIGNDFEAGDLSLTITAPPLALGEGYKGSWYINEVVFGENQTRTVQEDIYIYAKYEKLKCGVVFRKYNGIELKAIQVDYGAFLTEEDFPAHSVEVGYGFSWTREDDDLDARIVSDVVCNEVRTPNVYSYEFYFNDSANLLYSGECDFNAEFKLWSEEEIQSQLGNRYKNYLSYGWYRSESANPETESPIIGMQTQSAGTMRFYIKTKDLRRYTVHFYTQQGQDGIISANPAMSVTVGYMERATFDTLGNTVVGWKTAGIYEKGTSGALIANDTFFTPSNLFAEDKKENTLEVVVRYERETYVLEIYEPIFSESGNVLYGAVEGIPYETSLAAISELINYDTADKTVNVDGSDETFRFYGWADESGGLVDLNELLMRSAVKLYAKWIAFSEGSYGIEYEIRQDIGGAEYAEAVGYSGDSEEFIVGSKYISGGQTYLVKGVGIIKIAGKNISVTKVTIPSSVERIASGAFVDFYNVSEFEAAADSKHFTTTDGILYTKDGSGIIAYPRKKSGEFHVPDAVASIAESAFLGYSGGSVTFSEDSRLTRLGRDSFANAEGLTSIVLPNLLISIESGAFSNCVNLRSVTYSGSTLKKIGVGAFAGTPFYDEAQDGALMLGSVLLRFKGENVAENYVLDDAVTAIADGAFQGIAFKTVTIGSSSALTYVGGGAFADCPNLLSVTVEKTDAVIEFDLENHAFAGISYVGFAVYVPESLFSQYETRYQDTIYALDLGLQ